MGFVGASAITGATARGPPENGGGTPPENRGGGPCHKDFECDDIYVKFEFVTEGTPNGDACRFVEETDTGLISPDDLTWESKPESDCEPVSVSWDSDEYVVNEVMAFGGRDCDVVTGQDLTSFDTDLENNGGKEAAISNLQFCANRRIDIFGGVVSIAYEDLPLGQGNDYDYNDWVVTAESEAFGEEADDGFEADRLEMEFTPRARGAMADHRFGVVFPADEFCAGTWTLSYDDADGSGTVPPDATGAFDSSRDVVIFDRTSDVLPQGANTDASFGCACCTAPDYSATLTIEFDDPCTLTPDEFDLSDSPHGDDLAFEPYIEVYHPPTGQDGEVVAPGDVRILTVPRDWQWPAETTPIWDVYGDDTSGTVTLEGTTYEPVFDVGWYEATPEGAELASCDPDA